jgi:hypothetical protein
LVPTAGLLFGPDRNGDGASDLYLSNGEVDEILIFDGVSGLFLETFVPSGSGGLDDPKGLTMGADGNLYVVSNGNNAVLGYGAASQAALTVSLSRASALPVTVDFSTADGSAVGGSDYGSTIGTIVFNPGVTERTILIPTFDDSQLEPTENFTVNLSNSVGATIADAQGLAQIFDNEVSNAPPVVDAGADMIVSDDDGTGSETVMLLGTASDPDGTVVAYEWSDGLTVLGTSAALTTLLPIGQHTLTFSATDNDGAISSDSIVITVLANQGPSANAGNDITVFDTDQNGNETVSIVGGGSDADGSIVSYEWKIGSTVIGNTASISPTLPLGTHSLTLTVTDNGGATASDTIMVTVQQPATTNLLYVYDIRFESAKGGRLRRAVFEIRTDSNGDGQGGTTDNVAAGVQITVEFAGQTYTGTTDSNGVFRTAWLSRPDSGSYAEVLDLVLAESIWDPLLLDLEDDSDGDGLPDDIL